MTNEQHHEWLNYIQETVQTIIKIHMEVIPLYVEATTLYEYELPSEDGNTITVYDIPFSNLSSNGMNSIELIEGMMKTIDDEDVAWLIRKPSDASNNLPSILIPKELCRIIQIENISGILIDNNVHHLDNPFIGKFLDCVQNVLKDKAEQIFISN